MCDNCVNVTFFGVLSRITYIVMVAKTFRTIPIRILPTKTLCIVALVWSIDDPLLGRCINRFIIIVSYLFSNTN